MALNMPRDDGRVLGFRELNEEVKGKKVVAEYNPKAIELNMELKTLAKMIEVPKMSFFQKLMKKIIVAQG